MVCVVREDFPPWLLLTMCLLDESLTEVLRGPRSFPCRYAATSACDPRLARHAQVSGDTQAHSGIPSGHTWHSSTRYLHTVSSTFRRKGKEKCRYKLPEQQLWWLLHNLLAFQLLADSYALKFSRIAQVLCKPSPTKPFLPYFFSQKLSAPFLDPHSAFLVFKVKYLRLSV